MRMWVWASVALAPVALVGDIGLLGARSGSTASSGPALAAASPGETVALEAVQSWLAASPSPLPKGRVVAWLGASPVAATKAPKGSSYAGGPNFTAEIDRFSLVGPGGGTYLVGVEVATYPDGSAVALSGPSLEPAAPPVSSPASAGPWPGLNASSSVPSAVTQAVDGWAQAYTSGSASQLHLAVGDPNSSDYYRPLSGVASVTATPAWAAAIGPSAADEMIVQVTLDITWDSQAASAAQSSGNGPSGPQTTLDLLVARASTAAPVVVAWGPPGSGPTLHPYGNSI